MVVRTGQIPHTDPAHGTRARYVHRHWKCRCPACTGENTSYMRKYRARKAQEQGWTPRTWQQMGLPEV